jgi:hypothetical protein
MLWPYVSAAHLKTEHSCETWVLVKTEVFLAEDRYHVFLKYSGYPVVGIEDCLSELTIRSEPLFLNTFQVPYNLRQQSDLIERNVTEHLKHNLALKVLDTISRFQLNMEFYARLSPIVC